MSARFAFLIFAMGLLTASCSEKRATAVEDERKTERSESDQQPREDEIAQDCLAFVRATKVASSKPGADCPGCAAESTDVLAFREMKVERISCSADSCQVSVAIRAEFNRSAGGTVAGGLTAWIPPEQRLEYSRGQAPEGDQSYRVKIIYKRTGDAWRAIEFDRADPQ
jgi:hypothetical protein